MFVVVVGGGVVGGGVGWGRRGRKGGGEGRGRRGEVARVRAANGRYDREE